MENMKKCLESNILLFNQKKNISDVYYYNYMKIEINSVVGQPLDKTLNMQNTIFISFIFNNIDIHLVK